MKTMKMCSLIVFMLLLCQQLNFAKIYGVVKGKVVTEDSGKGLANVIVRLFKGNNIKVEETKTSSNGCYILRNLEPEFYTITFEPPFESGYCSLPYYDPRNILTIDNQREIYIQIKLEFNLNDGEIKVINKELRKGTKIQVKINIKNTDLKFSPKTLFRVRSKEKEYFEEIFLLGYGYQKVFPVGERIVIEGGLGNDEIDTIDVTKKVEIADTELQIINIDFDFSNTLEVKIIKPLNYNGDNEPSCSIYKFNDETNEYEYNPIAEFHGFEAVISGFSTGKYQILVCMGPNVDEIKWDYAKYFIFEIVPGKTKLEIEMQ